MMASHSTLWRRRLGVPSTTAALAMLVLVCSFARAAYAGINVWTSAGLEGAPISTLAIDPTTPSTLYAGTNPGRVFKSTDGGTQWSTHSTGLPPNTSILALATDPVMPNTLYVGMGLFFTSGGLFKSTDGGASWNATAPPATYVTALASDSHAPPTVYAGTVSCIEGACISRIFTSTDGFSSWKAGGIELTRGTNFTALAIDPLATRTLYAGTNGDGVYKSTDGSVQWNAINIGLDSLSVAALVIDPITPSTLYAGTFEKGVHKSTDGGAHWRRTEIGFPGFPNALALAIDPFTPTTIYAEVIDEEGGRGGLSRSIDGGVSWAALGRGLPGGQVNVLAIDRNRPPTLYAGTTGVFAIQPATFGVNSTAESPDATPGDGVCATTAGVCTLRAAVDEANALPGGSIITVPGGTYGGQLTIAVDLILRGTGAVSTHISGGEPVVRVGPGSIATISGVTIQNGYTGHNGGGGIVNDGTLTLENGTVSGNIGSEGGSGGGIVNNATLMLVNSTITGHTAEGGVSTTAPVR